jgi:hypothetical protein
MDTEMSVSARVLLAEVIQDLIQKATWQRDHGLLNGKV